MKTLLKVAIGAAVAGALINLVLGKRSRRGTSRQDSPGLASTSDGPLSSYDRNQAAADVTAHTDIPTRTARAEANRQVSEGVDET